METRSTKFQDILCPQGLNRTMQYGNGDTYDKVLNDILGLNRTMQYGNQTSKADRLNAISGLNRTMQYGNE